MIDSICQLSKIFNSKIDLPMSWVLILINVYILCFFFVNFANWKKRTTQEQERTRKYENILFNLSFLAVCELTHQSKSKRKTRTHRKPNKQSIRPEQSEWNCLRFADVFLLFEYKFQFVFQITGKCAHFCRQVYFLVVVFFLVEVNFV